jgi:DNA-binding response OmpR family regulator
MATRFSATPSVLLVNEAVDERDAYTRILRAAGYQAIAAENSVTAYRIAVTRPPDIVVTDVRLTRSISGLELTRRLRNNERTAAIPIIILIAVSRPHDAGVALKAGANTCLKKPVPGGVLRAEIARLLPPSRHSVPECAPRLRRSDRTVELKLSGRDSTGSITANINCPACDGPVVYRERSPVLTSDFARSGDVGRERMRYVSGWFCTNPACDYYETGPF